MQKLWNDVVAIVKAPFVGQLDLATLFLTVGLVLIFATVWVLILHHIKIAASEVI